MLIALGNSCCNFNHSYESSNAATIQWVVCLYALYLSVCEGCSSEISGELGTLKPRKWSTLEQGPVCRLLTRLLQSFLVSAARALSHGACVGKRYMLLRRIALADLRVQIASWFSECWNSIAGLVWAKDSPLWSPIRACPNMPLRCSCSAFCASLIGSEDGAFSQSVQQL